MKRLLLTGAGGYVGRHVLPLLAETDYDVVAVGRSPLPPELARLCRYVPGDLLNAAYVADLLARERPTHLLHLAWEATPGVYWTSPRNLQWTAASLELVRLFAEYGGLRAVLAGSCAEYDWNFGYLREGITPCRPHTLYGVCKNALQDMAAAYAAKAGLSLAWGRLFFSFGPHEHPARLVPSVVRGLLTRQPVECTHGRQIRDFLYIEDMAAAIVALLQSAVQGPVNIASGRPLSVADIVLALARRLGGANQIQFGALPLSPSEPPLLVADVSRLSDGVGFRYRRDLDEAIDLTVAFWKAALR